MASLAEPRPIDHLVLPVADLGVARDRMTTLGFTVAPEATHPFGTKNACVFFSDGTYLEPLAVGTRETWETAARKQNVFVARDRAYRFRCGGDGFSALAFGTRSAWADDREFQDAGLSAGPMLSFTRTFETAAGEKDEAGFRLAFAADPRAPDVFFFTCERTTLPVVDRSTLERHPNGAIGVSGIVLSEQNPSDFQYLLQEIAGQREVEAHSFGLTLALANGTLAALTPEGFAAHFGVRIDRPGRGLRLEAAVLAVADLAVARNRLERNGVVHQTHGRRLIVPPAPGQGALFAFEEKP